MSNGGCILESIVTRKSSYSYCFRQGKEGRGDGNPKNDGLMVEVCIQRYRSRMDGAEGYVVTNFFENGSSARAIDVQFETCTEAQEFLDRIAHDKGWMEFIPPIDD